MRVPAREAALLIPTVPVRALKAKADEDGSTEPLQHICGDMSAVATDLVAQAPSSLSPPPPARPQHATLPDTFEQKVVPVLKLPVAAIATRSRHEHGPLALIQALSLRVRSLGVELRL